MNSQHPPPLVFLPGLGTSAALFTRLQAALDSNFDSSPPYHHISLARPNVETFSQLLALARTQMPDRPCDLIGFSMGGYVAIALALAENVFVRRLILLNTRAANDEPGEATTRARKIQLLSNPRTRFDGVSKTLFKTLVGHENVNSEALFNFVQQMALDAGRSVTLSHLRAAQTRPDFRPNLPAIRQRTLIITGDDDKLTPPSRAKELKAGISDARLHILKGCGHLSPLERPTELATLIGAFLKR